MATEWKEKNPSGNFKRLKPGENEDMTDKLKENVNLSSKIPKEGLVEEKAEVEYIKEEKKIERLGVEWKNERGNCNWLVERFERKRLKGVRGSGQGHAIKNT